MRNLVVDLGALRQNVRTLTAAMGDVPIYGVCKGNGFGMGLVPFARTLLEEGIETLAVASIDDAAALRQALRRDFPGTTLVIISERVSAVREADCILVLENGHIDAQGCHDALMASCRRYQRMAKLQMGGDVG